MLEEKVKHKPRTIFGLELVPALIGGMIGTTLLGGSFAILMPYFRTKDFLEKEVITLEGTVVGERYVAPIADGREGSTPYPSQYFFSIDSTREGRIGIEVIDSYEPRVHLESVEVKLGIGTRVEIKARNVAPGEYKALANDVYVQK